MTDEELRTLVRAVIARQTGTAPDPVHQSLPRLHASHGLLTVPAGSEMDGPCMIEPAVMCNHCGYCQSFGH